MSAAAPNQPSAVRWIVVAPCWAGVLGAGIVFCALGFVWALHDDRLLPGSQDVWMICSCLAAIAVALFRGYDSPVRSYPALVGRLFGGLLAGVLVIVGVVALADARRGWFDHGVGFVVAGAVCIALPLARLHGRRLRDALRASPSSRWKAAAGAAAVALVSAAALSARVRCALGSGSGCYRAAQHAHDEADDALALRLAERGCALDDDSACAMGGRAYWRGFERASASPTPRDRARAEELLGSGCALGAPDACRDLGVMDLERGCEGYRASACHALADAYRQGEGVPRDREGARWASSQACLLGDTEACAAR